MHVGTGTLALGKGFRQTSGAASLCGLCIQQFFQVVDPDENLVIVMLIADIDARCSHTAFLLSPTKPSL